eukprot:631335-Rhodomonas_salina.1
MGVEQSTPDAGLPPAEVSETQAAPETTQSPAALSHAKSFNVAVRSVTDSMRTTRETQQRLRQAQEMVDTETRNLAAMLPDLGATARTGYLQTLTELIGKPQPGKTWEEEWVKLRCESFRMSPTPSIDVSWSDAELENFVRTQNTVEIFQEKKRQPSIDALMARGWRAEDARAFAILSVCSGPIARALKQHDPCFVASTYALCRSLYCTQGESASNPAMLYRHLHGQFSLTQVDPSWERLLQPDSTGFCGLTNSGITFGLRPGQLQRAR